MKIRTCHWKGGKRSDNWENNTFFSITHHSFASVINDISKSQDMTFKWQRTHCQNVSSLQVLLKCNQRNLSNHLCVRFFILVANDTFVLWQPSFYINQCTILPVVSFYNLCSCLSFWNEKISAVLMKTIFSYVIVLAWTLDTTLTLSAVYVELDYHAPSTPLSPVVQQLCVKLLFIGIHYQVSLNGD